MSSREIPPVQRVLTLLAKQRGMLDERERRALVHKATRRDSTLTAADLLIAEGHCDGEQAAALQSQARRIEWRLAAIQAGLPLSDHVDRVARQALSAGLLTIEGLRLALVRQDGASEAEAVVPLAPLDGRRRLGRYPVVGELGRGGMGQVLAVYDEDLGREVAAKLIIGKADEGQLAKFIREGRVTGQLEHPAIVPAYELGRTSDGELYLTMKKIEGDELGAVIERVKRERESSGDRLSATAEQAESELALQGLPRGLLRLLQIFLKVCDGVAFAHSKGVVHRDLKPANIMVGEFGEVLILDWGLAKIIGEQIDGDWRGSALAPKKAVPRMSTMDGQVKGTPVYMAPEQAEGRIDEIDERVDIYSLGAILYELLTLEPAFQLDNVVDLLIAVSTKPPIAPRVRVGGRWPVPRELEQIVDTAMSKRKEDRYQSVEELEADVEAYLAGSAPTGARGDLSIDWRLVAGVLALLLALLLAFGR